MNVRRITAITAASLIGITVLAGCGGSSSEESSAAASSSAAAESPMPGQSMLPPVIIEPDQTTATAKVGDALYFNVPDDKLAGTTIDTTTPDLVEVTQAREEDGVTYAPGGKALAAGDAVVEVTNPDGSVRTVTITISE